jgi:oligopeptide/dipeptide ABC transporter ATP-binding protein
VLYDLAAAVTADGEKQKLDARY